MRNEFRNENETLEWIWFLFICEYEASVIHLATLNIGGADEKRRKLATGETIEFVTNLYELMEISKKLIRVKAFLSKPFEFFNV